MASSLRLSRSGVRGRLDLKVPSQTSTTLAGVGRRGLCLEAQPAHTMSPGGLGALGLDQSRVHSPGALGNSLPSLGNGGSGQGL